MKLRVGALHVWSADLDAACNQIEWPLDEREHERAARIVREPARRRWTAARGVLRVLLGDYLGESPRLLRFAREAHGKPSLDLPGAERLRFNLSHSGALAVYALTEMCAVGVDVELVDRHPGTRVHRRDFLRAWVMHEAEVKRLGVGVRNTPQSARTSGPPPWIAEIDPGRGAVGAVALATEPVDFRVFTFDLEACGSILTPATGTTVRTNETFPDRAIAAAGPATIGNV